MKNLYLKSLLVLSLLANTYSAIAGPPPGDDDPQEANINAKLVMLLVVGLVFGAYVVAKNLRKEKAV